LGCNISQTYFDVPRIRTMAHGQFLKAGLAYQFHPHRDTWYAAPSCQVNWWLPLYEVRPDNTMAFHPRYWSQPVRNSSGDYNYNEWKQKCRPLAAQQIRADTRKQPKAEEQIELDPQVRLVCKVGAIVLFSAAQLHSTVPNTSGYTRYSLDFRTVHFDDVVTLTGAPNVDSACTGTTLGDFLRARDLSRLPAETIAMYDDATPGQGELPVKQPVGVGL